MGKVFRDEQSERAIAAVLRYGSLLSTAVMAFGLALLPLRSGAGLLRSAYLIRSGRLFLELIQLDAAALMELGILLLLMTPIFRVVVAAISFARRRDTKYVLVSLGVLAVILLSVSFAVRG